MVSVHTCTKFLALLALITVAFALPDEVQKQEDVTEVQDEDVSDDSIVDMRGDHWIPCEYTITPAFSCLDCRTRLICKPYGGKVKHCGHKYCRNGFCSDIPSAECA